MCTKEDNDLKEHILSKVKPIIMSWNTDSIYAISMFVYDEDESPSKPTFTLGYNTEDDYAKLVHFASSELEARWNYAFWNKREELVFGTGDTYQTVHKWLVEKGFSEYTYEDVLTAQFDQEMFDAITKSFVNVLINVVKELHSSDFIKKKFGKEIPIIIHELEYYDEILLQNIEANSASLVKGLADYMNDF